MIILFMVMFRPTFVKVEERLWSWLKTEMFRGGLKNVTGSVNCING